MKKILIILSVFLLSCNNPIEKVENSAKETTIEIQENIKDTMQISIVNDKIYLLKDNKVEYTLINDTKGYTVIDVGLLIFLIIGSFLGAIYLIQNIFD